MAEEIFRKKSLDRINSPENLNEYIRVSSPGVWLLLAAIVALLVGACIWGMFGTVESSVKADVRIENGVAVCRVAEKDITSVKVGAKVKIGDIGGTVTQIGEKDENGYICSVSLDAPAADGIYDARIVTESIRPMSFIFN